VVRRTETLCQANQIRGERKDCCSGFLGRKFVPSGKGNGGMGYWGAIEKSLTREEAYQFLYAKGEPPYNREKKKKGSAPYSDKR